MTTVIKLNDGGFRVFSKGASEMVLQRFGLFYLILCSSEMGFYVVSAREIMFLRQVVCLSVNTRSSAVAERPRDASRH